MGVESANYAFVPDQPLEAIPRLMVELGAEERSPFPATNFQRWALRGEHYWIDIMLGSLGPSSRPSVSVRVALCNPLEVGCPMEQLFQLLLRELQGTLLDRQTKRSYRSLDQASWLQVWDAFCKKKEEFHCNFGVFEAAISGDDVFACLAARNNES